MHLTALEPEINGNVTLYIENNDTESTTLSLQVSTHFSKRNTHFYQPLTRGGGGEEILPILPTPW